MFKIESHRLNELFVFFADCEHHDLVRVHKTNCKSKFELAQSRDSRHYRLLAFVVLNHELAGPSDLDLLDVKSVDNLLVLDKDNDGTVGKQSDVGSA